MNLFELFAKISLDSKGFNEGIKSASGTFTKFGNAVKSGAAAAAKAAAAGISAIASATAALGTQSVKAYANYEQFVGGVAKLFGDSSDEVIKNAEKAYTTAGLSTNEYLDNVIKFSASLINGLAKTTQKAYDINLEAETEALQESLETQKQSHEEQLEALQESLDAKYNATAEANENALQALKESHEAQLEEVTQANERILDELKARNDDEIAEFERATEEKISLINKEYAEKLKLLDADAYAEQTAFQEQIDAIQADIDATKAAEKQKTIEKKKQLLAQKIEQAKTDDERAKAQEDLSEYLAKLDADALEAQRKAQIDALKQQIKDSAAAAKEKKDALKEQYDAEVADYKQARSEELDALKAAQAKELQSVKDAQAAQLKELKAANAKALAEAKAANTAQLKELKAANTKALNELKASNKAKESETKAYVKSRTKLLEKMSEVETTVTGDMAEAQKKAAEYADMAIQDMADNVNMFGSSMASVQNAYSGFAKANYTMLDNLRLGYGGTKEEMERLIADANRVKEANGEMATLSISSFADMVEAIHIIQTEMKITGTTQKEASTTITGSISAALSSWKNFALELSKDAPNLGIRVQELKETSSQAFTNIADRVNVFADNLSSLLTETIPTIIEEIPKEIDNPSGVSKVLEAGKRLMGTIVTGVKVSIPKLGEATRNAIDWVVDWFTTDANLSGLATAATSFVHRLGDWIIKKTYYLAEAALKIIGAVSDSFLSRENFSAFLEAAENFVSSVSSALLDYISNHRSELMEIANSLTDAIFLLTEKAVAFVVDFAKGLVKVLFDALTGQDNLDSCTTAGEQLGYAIGDGIGLAIRNAFARLGGWIADQVAGLVHDASVMLNQLTGGLIPETDYTPGEYLDDVKGALKAETQKKQLEEWKAQVNNADFDPDLAKKAKEMADAEFAAKYGNTLIYDITVNAAGASAAETADSIQYNLDKMRMMGLG